MHRLVQGVVAGSGGDVGERQVRLRESRQDSREDDFAALAARRGAHARHVLVELLVHVGEAGAAEEPRRQVRLEVEARQLGGEGRVVQVLENLDGHRRRTPRLVYEKQLLLRADAADARLDHAVGQHPLQSLEIPEERPREDPHFLGRPRWHYVNTHCPSSTVHGLPECDPVREILPRSDVPAVRVISRKHRERRSAPLARRDEAVRGCARASEAVQRGCSATPAVGGLSTGC